MSFFQSELAIRTTGKGTYDLTSQIQEALSQSGTADGLCVVFCRHTSCSLVLMENADPSARRDLENYLDRLVPDDDPHFTHTYEGPDDMPSHIKMALTRSSSPFLSETGGYNWELGKGSSYGNIECSLIGDRSWLPS